jgi:hypothetical protein
MGMRVREGNEGTGWGGAFDDLIKMTETDKTITYV